MLDANVGCHLPEIAVVVNVEQYRGLSQKKIRVISNTTQ